ncbi:hypothetical protein [Kribbella sindirgiensis]|uniref:Uncharacterized protein n=1 Tax=Kribbella sindirgiensis TaxID=1124744 RepID=A0A4R0INA9_9ACTN|nr:hypothetical protein [Kribbella sindirgiensis]TCC35111.1 hypothetical protein E0H50_14695 [Kribbella sindirgiensis]
MSIAAEGISWTEIVGELGRVHGSPWAVLALAAAWMVYRLALEKIRATLALELARLEGAAFVSVVFTGVAGCEMEERPSDERTDRPPAEPAALGKEPA